ncbi:MAG: hypothetical protein ABIY50_03520 [Ignavibacteria bacterium]
MIKFIFFILISVNISKAQSGSIVIDSVYRGNFLITNLQSDINLANLNSVANYTHRFEKFGVSVSNYYLSNVSKLGQNFFRDYNNFRFLLFYNVKKNLDAGIGFQNKFLTDDKNVETNKNNSSFYFTNLDYRLNNNVFLNSKIGFKTEDQIGENNSGFSGILTGEADNFFYKNYLTSGKLILFYENLIQKQNHNYELSANIYKRFTEEADNTGYIKFYNQRNDFFSPATPSIVSRFNVRNNIERRTENYYYIGDKLNYSLSKNLTVSLGGILANRNITKEFRYRASSANILLENIYDTKIIEDNLELSGALNYNWNKIISQLKLVYSERSENHSLLNTAGLTPSQVVELERAEKNKNNNAGRTSLLLDIIYYLSNTNSFGFTGSTSLLRYDTDFDENFDDRDELETVFSAVHRYDNLLNFDLQTRFDVILSKLSYIFSQRSANNYKNNIYKLTSQSIFSPIKKLTSKNTVQVLANYTIYDFEDIVSQVQSFSYRQLSIKDSTRYSITRGLSLDFNGEVKLYEQGQFNNREFSVKPIAYFEEQFYNSEIGYMINDFLEVKGGYKFFRQNRYLYETAEKKLVNTFTSSGPVGKINLYLNNNSIINFTGGVDFIQYSNPPQENSAVNLQLNVLWNM